MLAGWHSMPVLSHQPSPYPVCWTGVCIPHPPPTAGHLAPVPALHPTPLCSFHYEKEGEAIPLPLHTYSAPGARKVAEILLSVMRSRLLIPGMPSFPPPMVNSGWGGGQWEGGQAGSLGQQAAGTTRGLFLRGLEGREAQLLKLLPQPPDTSTQASSSYPSSTYS